MEEIKIADLVLKGWIERGKIVRKCTPTSGALYLHKSLIGKKFDVFFIPVEEEPQVESEVKKVEEKFDELKKDLE
jgi:hypothetical protein